MVAALIQLTQGAQVGAAGVAIIGVLTTSVVVSNGNNAGASTLAFEIVDAPPGSTVPVGVNQQGALTQYTFIPDKTGGYLIHLTVQDNLGNLAEDFRVFQVPEPSGRIIPPFKASDKSLNFIISAVMNKRGWALFQEAYDRAVDAGGSRNIRVVTTTGPINVGDSLISVGATAGAITLTLPAAPPLGTTFYICDDAGGAAAHNITVNGGGANLLGVAAITMTQNFASVTVTYNGTTWSVT